MGRIKYRVTELFSVPVPSALVQGSLGLETQAQGSFPRRPVAEAGPMLRGSRKLKRGVCVGVREKDFLPYPSKCDTRSTLVPKWPDQLLLLPTEPLSESHRGFELISQFPTVSHSGHIRDFRRCFREDISCHGENQILRLDQPDSPLASRIPRALCEMGYGAPTR